MSMSCLLAWISVILITIIIFPSYQFLMGLHMNVKKQNKPTQINLYSECMEKITVLCLVESVEQ